MKKILLTALIVASANAEVFSEVCVNGINPFGVKRMVDVCVVFPSDKMDSSTKHQILKVFSLKEIEELSTWIGKEHALKELSEITQTKNLYYSKISFYSDCQK